MPTNPTINPRRQWTPEETKAMTTLWVQGLSASQIATEMGPGFNRNMIIGKVHRLKLSTRETKNQTKAAARKGYLNGIGAKKKQAKRPTLPALPINRPDIVVPRPKGEAAFDPLPISVPKRMVDLGDIGRKDHLGECRWPIGGNPTLFCACAAYETYCPTHAALSRPKVAL